MSAAAAAGRSRLERELQVELDGDVLADEHAAGLEGRVPGEAEVFAVDNRLGGRAGLVVAPRVGAEAAEVERESRRLGDAARRTPVERKSIVGYVSTSKNSAERRCWSRPSSLVSTEVTSTDASTVASRGFSGATIVALFMPKVPRTFEIIMWRTEKVTSLCEGSSTQVPAL